MNSSFTLRPSSAPQSSDDAQASAPSSFPSVTNNPISLEGGIRLNLGALSHLSLRCNTAYFRPGSQFSESNSFQPITQHDDATSTSLDIRRHIISPFEMDMMARDDTEDFALWEGERDDVSPRKVLFCARDHSDEEDERMQETSTSEPSSPKNSRKRKSRIEDDIQDDDHKDKESGDMQRRRIQ